MMMNYQGKRISGIAVMLSAAFIFSSCEESENNVAEFKQDEATYPYGEFLVPMSKWENEDGQMVMMELLEVEEGGIGVFSREDGEIFRYQIAKLSETDQESIRYALEKVQPLIDEAEAHRIDSEAEELLRAFKPDGSHRALVKEVKSRMHDPSTFEHVSTRIVGNEDEDGNFSVVMEWRGVNGFNAKRLTTTAATVTKGGDLVYILYEE